MELPELKSCGFLIVRGEPIESFLLMRHPDRWDLPKGHVDPGETELECALRELEEETNIAADQIEIDDAFRFVHRYPVPQPRQGYRVGDKTLIIFLGRLRHDVPIKTSEHESYRWFDWNPPHRIQQKTIDPLLAELDEALSLR